MPKKTPEWQQFEQEVQSCLGLDATICSGNKWNDVGDAVSNASPHDDPFRLLVDCKYTDKASFSVTAKFMGQWVGKATEVGKRFLLAIRLCPPGSLAPRDYVVLPFEDFEELLLMVRERRAYSDTPVAPTGPDFSGWGAVPVIDRTWLDGRERG